MLIEEPSIIGFDEQSDKERRIAALREKYDGIFRKSRRVKYWSKRLDGSDRQPHWSTDEVAKACGMTPNRVRHGSCNYANGRILWRNGDVEPVYVGWWACSPEGGLTHHPTRLEAAAYAGISNGAVRQATLRHGYTGGWKFWPVGCPRPRKRER